MKKKYHSQWEKVLWKLAACALAILLLTGIGGLRLTPTAALRTAEEIMGCGETQVLWRQNEWVAGRVRSLSVNEQVVLVTDAVLGSGGWNAEGTAVLDCSGEEPFYIGVNHLDRWQYLDWYYFGKINVPGAVQLRLELDEYASINIPQSSWLTGKDGTYFYTAMPFGRREQIWVKLFDASGELLFETEFRPMDGG